MRGGAQAGSLAAEACGFKSTAVPIPEVTPESTAVSPLWRVNFLRKGVTTVPEDDVECPFIVPEVGITSTPVIDADTETLYVLARTKIRHGMSSDEYFQHLHALAITTGVEKFGGPKLISASAAGNGRGSHNGQIAFDPLKENPRAAA